MDMGDPLRTETLGMGEGPTGQKESGLLKTSQSTPASESGLLCEREKNLPSSFKPLLAWVSVTNSFIYVLINSKGKQKAMNENDTCPNGKFAVKALFHISISLFVLFRKVARTSGNGVSCLQV